MLRLLQIKPSPDWKGREAVAERQWRGLGPPEPWKAGKNAKEGLDGHGVPDTVDERGALQKEIKRKNFTPMKFSIILELYRRFYLNLKTRM